MMMKTDRGFAPAAYHRVLDRLMLRLLLEAGDVFEAKASVIVIPIDGQAVVPPEHLPRILGNIGRQFLRQFPEAELVEELDSQLVLPLRLGTSEAIELDRSPYRTVVVVSTLHHLGEMSDQQKRAVVRQATLSAVAATIRAGEASLATAVLQGGWRLPSHVALQEMLRAAAECEHDIELQIRLADDALLPEALTLARGLGLLTAG